jgi:hypothetical protein
MKHIAILGATTVLAATGLAAAADPDCSIHPPAGATQAQLQKMAKVSQQQAEGYAQQMHVSDAARGYQDAKLETVNDCLVWSVNIRNDNDPGVLKVHIDAGNGKLLGTVHEAASER